MLKTEMMIYDKCTEVETTIIRPKRLHYASFFEAIFLWFLFFQQDQAQSCGIFSYTDVAKHILPFATHNLKQHSNITPDAASYAELQMKNHTTSLKTLSTSNVQQILLFNYSAAVMERWPSIKIQLIHNLSNPISVSSNHSISLLCLPSHNDSFHVQILLPVSIFLSDTQKVLNKLFFMITIF